MKVLAAAIALAFGCLTAMPAAAQQITGAGSTFVYPVLVKWADTGGEFDVRRMFQSEPPRIDLDGTVQASRGTAPTGHGWQGGEFATSI